MTNDDIELADAVRRLEEFHRASMAQNIERDEAKIWNEEETESWNQIYDEAKSKILSAIAFNMYGISLKASATKMIVDLHNSDKSFDDAINKADSYESVALSTVRDLLKFAA